MERGSRFLASRSSIWSPASPPRTIPHRRRGPIAVVPVRPTRDPYWQKTTTYITSFFPRTTRTPSRTAPGKARASPPGWPWAAPRRRLRRTVLGAGAFPPFFQAADRGQSGYSFYPSTESLHITVWCASCSTAETRTPSCRRRRAGGPNFNTANQKGFPAASPAPPPSHLQVSRRHPAAVTAVAACTASPPFRPTCPLRWPATAVLGQPRPSPQSTSWGGSCGETTVDGGSQLCRPIYFIHI